MSELGKAFRKKLDQKSFNKKNKIKVRMADVSKKIH